MRPAMDITRRSMLAGLGAPVLARAQSKAPRARPNFLFILADDRAG